MYRFLSLRFALPGLIGVFTILTISLSFYMSRSIVFDRVAEEQEIVVRDRLNSLQGVVSHFMKYHEYDYLRGMVSSISSETDLNYLAIVSKDDIVIAASKYTDQGKHWKQVSPAPDAELIEKIILRQTIDTYLYTDKKIIDGYSSFCVTGNDALLRADDCGFIFYQVDLGFHFDRAEASIYNGFLFVGLTFFAGIFLLLFFTGRLITRRVNHLVDTLKSYSDGDHNIRSATRGHDEISWLSTSINSLLDRIDKNQEQILEREHRLEGLFQSVLDAIVVIDDQGIIRRANRATEKMFGYTEDELAGHNVSILMPEPYKSEHDGYLKNYKVTGIRKVIGIKREVNGQRRDNTVFPIDISVSEMLIGSKKMYSGIIRDITERKDFERIMKNINDELLQSNKKLNEYATKDSLTNIYNRRSFDIRIDEELNRATRDKLPLSLLMCDIDYFKLYNDTYGHQEGDKCLYKVATVIKTFFQRGGEMVARYGGEEFAVILPNTDADRAKWLSELLIKAIHELGIAHSASKASDHITISIGVGTYNPTGHIPTSSSHLIRAADEGLYKAKANGRDRVETGATIE
ncbi:MAG: diguanylate cyclase [Gammaproteobacteria bacterium]|nr:diguanylate cyclase [Gammaproteobacteria bacterium]